MVNCYNTLLDSCRNGRVEENWPKSLWDVIIDMYTENKWLSGYVSFKDFTPRIVDRYIGPGSKLVLFEIHSDQFDDKFNYGFEPMIYDIDNSEITVKYQSGRDVFCSKQTTQKKQAVMRGIASRESQDRSESILR